MPVPDHLFPRLTSVISRIATSSAISPLLWLTGVITPCGLAAAAFSEGTIRWAFFVLAAVPVVYTIIAYDFFMRKDPRRLQSESYQLRRHIIENHGDEKYDAPFVKAVLGDEDRSVKPTALPPPEENSNA